MASASNRDAPRVPPELAALAARRIAIEGVVPTVDGGRFAAKCVAGEPVDVEADVFCDGHEVIAAAVRLRARGARRWSETPMSALGNDRWHARLVCPEPGFYEFDVVGWRDSFASWQAEIHKKLQAGQAVTLELAEGRALLEHAVRESPRSMRAQLGALLGEIDAAPQAAERLALLTGEAALALMRAGSERSDLTRSAVFPLFADRERAACGAWYELFPRSQAGRADVHGSFDDVIARLPYVRALGFDVLYLPPIHPIGRTNRKGRNNSLVAGPDDPGSPYAIGSEEGGHDAIHPELGSIEDFARLVTAAHEHGLELALDFAIQCSPDHPWIREHPEWFEWRPDGSIRFAENPPKKYEDIVNVRFYGAAFPEAWLALRDVVLYWLGHGVRIFRVDNPHTKPLPFWEWLIREVHDVDPGVVFLSEAFTRPKMMKRLAKVGFNQSYTYFTWRNTKQELTEYLTELTEDDCRHYMRANFFVNTPDINPIYLQSGGRAAFRVRLFLAATLGANYGVYSGFELCESAAVPGREEYLNSEKYEIRAWDWERPGHIQADVARLNGWRRAHPALRRARGVRFYQAWNDAVLYYGRFTEDFSDFVLCAVNLDPHHPQAADFEVPLWELGLADDAAVDAHDLVLDRAFTWHGKLQHMYLDPQHNPYLAWRLLAPLTRR